MEQPISSVFKPGIVHFMAFPETLKDESILPQTVEKIANDDFFGAIELTSISDPVIKKEVISILKTSHLEVGFGAQPQLLSNKLNLNSADAVEREKAIRKVKDCVDEAVELNASKIAVLSGPASQVASLPQDAAGAVKLLVDSLTQVCHYAEQRDRTILLETFDDSVDKKCLVGSSRLAVKIAKMVKKEYGNFGLLIDLSHLPLLNETPKQALIETKKHLSHVHIGNCVFRDKNHPAYGDQHPGFGTIGGENDVAQVAEFLKQLIKIGYFDREQLPVVSFEVKPVLGEKSETLISGSKRVLLDAWAIID